MTSDRPVRATAWFRPASGARRRVAVVVAGALLATTLAIGRAAGSSPVDPPAKTFALANATLTEVGSPFVARPLLPFGGPRLDSFATGDLWSSPAVADVTGDGVPDIVVGGGVSSSLQVYQLDGSTRALIDVGGVDQSARSGGVQGSPIIKDLNGDGVADVLVGSTANVLSAYSVRGSSGATRLWSRQDPPIVRGGPTGFLATPALGFLQGDGPDVVTASWGQALGANDAETGAQLPGWPNWLYDSIWSSPAIGDIDGDGANDVVVGGDCAGNDQGTQPCGNVGGGYVWAFNRDGSQKWRWFYRGQVIWSSPALGDLNGDGALDVVVGTGGYWPEPAGRMVTALNGRDGSVLWQSSTPARAVGSPSLADVTGDGRPEVFLVSYGGTLLSYDGATGKQRWSACITDDGRGCPRETIGTKSGVALADVDNDGRIEAVVHGEQQMQIYDAQAGTLEAKRGSNWGGTVYAPANTPTIAQINGQTYIFQALTGTWNGQDQFVVEAWRTGSPLGAAPWPTARGNMQRTGVVATAGDRTAVESFVSRSYRDFLDRSPTSGELAAWSDRVQRGQVSRYEFTMSLAHSDEWISTVITRFYRDTLGRAPDAGGLAGWVRAARSGMSVAQIASAFYASPEYFQTTGRNSNEVWVRDLYRKLLLRDADPGGLAGWVRALEAGMPRQTLSFGFYQAPETLRVRINYLYQALLGRPAEPGAVVSWSGFVSAIGDLALAAALASSTEYYQRR